MTSSFKVLIGSPICDKYKYCITEYLDALKRQTYPCDILLVDNSCDERQFSNSLKEKNINVIHINPESRAIETVTKCRNFMIQYAIDNNYDFIFFADADTIIPSYALEKLILSGKDIISGVVYNFYEKEGNTKKLPALWTWLTEGEFNQVLQNPEIYPVINQRIRESKITSHTQLRKQLTENDIIEPKIMEVKYCGAACLLIYKKVFVNTKFNLDKVDQFETKGEDIGFCNQARFNNHKIYANTEVICEHLVKDKEHNIFKE